jgi:hypothetical protein
MRDILEVIKNVESIYSSNSALSTLKDFERVLDEMNMYVYKNWQDGELASGPRVDRHWISASFMWPREKMPEPKGGQRLLDYGCTVQFAESNINKVRKIKTPDDIRPGTRKGKIDQEPVWMVKISMPKKLMHDITRGYTELDKNKIEDILTMNGGVNAHIDPAEQQAQDIANAEQPTA